jgi:hypothetical protein
MAHHGKAGSPQVSLNITPEQREDLLRLTGERTLTAAVHEALADLVIEAWLREAIQRRWEREHPGSVQ